MRPAENTKCCGLCGLRIVTEISVEEWRHMDRRKVIVIFIAVALLMHVSLSSLYIFRDSVAPRWANWAIDYCSPLFHQNWMLFAPNVSEYDVQLQYGVDYEGKRKWLDITDESLGSSPIDRAERYFANALTWDYVHLVYSSGDTLNFTSFVQSRSFQNARKWVCNYIEKTNYVLSDSLQMRLFYTFYDAENAQGVPRLDSIQLPPCNCIRHAINQNIHTLIE